MALRRVSITPRRFGMYRAFTSAGMQSDIARLARHLRGARIVHLNATPKGGGVAEMLQTSVALLRDLGLDASWYVLDADARFYEITKSIHNFLQGKGGRFRTSDRSHYLSWNERFAKAMAKIPADIWMVHDPQPAASILFFPERPPMVLRSHIDTSHPNPEVIRFFRPIFRSYDRAIFTMEAFLPPRFRTTALFFAPVIDPTTEKNRPLLRHEARAMLKRLGVDPKRPLLAQVSRFDPWKDPLGVLEVYWRVRKRVPGLQFLYAGVMLAQDDPEAMTILDAMRQAAGKDRDAHLFWEKRQLRGISVDRFVNAVQTGADVILQKSTREGFGLTVSEAMWKGQPVIGGAVGGIRLQIRDGVNGYLVRSSAAAENRALRLFADPKRKARMGRRARADVRKSFLMPRLIRDELRLYRDLIGRR